MSDSSIAVAVIGATGIAGQQFLSALSKHPMFHVTALVASSRSAGKTYEEALCNDDGQLCWYGDDSFTDFADMIVVDAKTYVPDVSLVFSCVDGAVAMEIESRYARHVPVISTTSAFRYEDDTPLLIPNVNLSHAALLKRQQETRGFKGFVVPQPNCTTLGLAITLAPLHEQFKISHVTMTSMQAVSGAGRTPGVSSLDILDNIIPYIVNEEQKIETELKKILGISKGTTIQDASFFVSCACYRVPVIDGHTESVFVEFEQDVSEKNIREALTSAGTMTQDCPSSPMEWITVFDDPYRPQVRLDRERGNGLTTSVGRLRQDGSARRWKYTLVSHNTKAGAARGAILLAEWLYQEGWLSV